MRAEARMNGRSLRVILCVLVGGLLGACGELKPIKPNAPPTQATPQQAAERNRESPPSKVVQARSDKGNPQQCLVNFDDEGALTQILGQARSTVAMKTGRAPSGQLQMCDPSKHSDCWTYRQRCSNHEVNIDSLGLAHFHLSMETGIECYTLPDPGDGLGRGFGKLVEWKCSNVDWAQTPRVLSSHDLNQWIKVWVSDADNHAPTYFDLESIRVLPDTSIQLWFQKRDGTWWFWPELTAGKTWNTREWVHDVSEVRLRGTRAGRASSYIIGSFVIRD